MSFESSEEVGQWLFAAATKELPPEVFAKVGIQGAREVCLAVAPLVLAAMNLSIVYLANLLAREGVEAAKGRIERAGGRVSEMSLEVLRGRMKPVARVKRSSFLDALDELNYERK